ncbi:MAG: response regulator [Chitinivibrionales bacterium]
MVSKKILVIDDNPKVCETMLVLLESIGMKAFAATSSLEGITKAYDIEPDLILLDILLPDFSGWAVLDQLRADPIMSHTPVAVFSALVDSAAHLREGQQLIDGYLPKPFKMHELRGLITRTTTRSPRGTSSLESICS